MLGVRKSLFRSCSKGPKFNYRLIIINYAKKIRKVTSLYMKMSTLAHYPCKQSACMGRMIVSFVHVYVSD